MAASDDGPNFTDFIVTSISPVLIVGLVGSLVFFLVEILYGGKYEGRLLWTLFFFVIGIVLVARVAIQVDAGRAMAYGLALAVVCWLALMAFIEYPRDSSMAPFAPIINLVLMGVVWWCANKLTWDCTFIDENRISASKGLLVASGMEPRSDSSDKTLPEPKRGKARGGFWERYQRYRDRRAKQPHTPGVTVVYFSLAALPIFGLGQSLIPSDDASRRSFAFTLAACYVGCGLGLLLTTSFLGLAVIYGSAGVKMPVVMTGTWLGMGSVLIAGFLLVAALLPRPYSETPIWNLDRIGSPDRKASKNALFAMEHPVKETAEAATNPIPERVKRPQKMGSREGKEMVMVRREAATGRTAKAVANPRTASREMTTRVSLETRNRVRTKIQNAVRGQKPKTASKPIPNRVPNAAIGVFPRPGSVGCSKKWWAF